MEGEGEGRASGGPGLLSGEEEHLPAEQLLAEEGGRSFQRAELGGAMDAHSSL